MSTLILTIAYSVPILVLVFMFLVLMRSHARKRQEVKYFGYFLVTLIVWLVLLWISDELNNSNSLFTLNVAIFVGSFAPLLLFLFAEKYVGVTSRLVNSLLIATSILFALSSVLGWMALEVSSGSTGVNIKSSSILYVLQGFYTIAVFAFAIVWIKYFAKKEKNKDLLRQSQYIILATILSGLIGIVGGLLFSNVGGSNLLSPVAVTVFVAGAFIAIFKHRLFDVRLVVARTVGYALSITMLATLYGVLAFNVVDVFSSSLSRGGQQVVYTLLAVVLAFTFQPLKRFFDRLSNKLFYRDAYDSQELLDGLNKILVSTLDINKLLKSSAEEINKSIRSEFVLFGIKKIEDSPQRIIGTSDRQFSQKDIEFVRSITPKMRQKSIIVDELEDTEPKLKDLLHKNNIALLVRLTDTPNKVQEGLGYIVLGDKKSGGQYTKQDLQVLEIIADELVIAIQNALRFEEIQNFNITLQGRVDDATKRLRSANNRLVELDQTKDDFISMASHQLRTPLTTIKGYLSMVLEGDVGKISGKQSELLGKAFISSQQMVYLIADLLNVSRLRTGKFVIEAKETNLTEVINGEIDQLIETAKAKNLKIDFVCPKDFPTLMLDEVKIRQVIMNFVDNAIYYTPAGGHIAVALADKGKTVEFTVTDNGIGVPKAEQHHLFTKFYRAGNAKKARPDGTGLGLFMAKKVVIAQSGSIIFSSQENKGSIFGFSFSKDRLLPENYKGVVHTTSA